MNVLSVFGSIGPVARVTPRKTAEISLVSLIFLICSWVCLPSPGLAKTDVAVEDCHPQIVKGVIDLACWKGDSLELRGEWAFSWRPEGSSDARKIGIPPAYAQVPSRWRDMEFDQGEGPAFGHAEYKARLTFTEPQKGLALFPGRGITTYKIFLRFPSGEETTLYDNRLEDGTEIVSNDLITLPELPSQSELILQVSNNYHYSGSIDLAPKLGSLQLLIEDQLQQRALAAMLFGGYIFFGLYNLVLAFGYQKSRLFFVMAAICFACAVRLMNNEELVTAFWSIVPLSTTWYIGWATFFSLGLLWPIYIWMRYPSVYTLNFVRISSGLSLTGIVLTVATGPYIFLEFGIWYGWFIFLAIITAVPFFVYNFMRGKLSHMARDASGIVTMISVLIVSIGILVDIYLYSVFKASYIDYSSLAFFILLAGQSFIVAREYTRGLEIEKELGLELRLVNAGLEKQVTHRTKELVSINDRLEEMVRTDQLTGLPNRKAFEEAMIREIERFDRTEMPLSLFLLDADHFKSINDTYGHDIGDIVLKHLSDIISQEARVIDFPSRIGGEEFAIVLTQTDLNGAQMLAERIRSEVEKAMIVTGGDEIRFTISGGISCYRKGLKSQEFFREADQGLYQAKESGRNKIVIKDQDRE